MPCKNPVFITLLEFCSRLDINFSGSDILSNSNKIIIGMTGPFGSGCTYISKSIINDLGYEYISLSDILRKKCAEDVIILNEKHIHSKATDSFRDLNAIANKYIDLIESKSCFEPSEMETLMTMAYANSMRSSCTQRKVGALIIDNYGNVFSSGYNEVPSSERPCINQYGMCYRKYLRANIDKKLNDILHDTELTSKVSKTIKNNSKMLDYCRALHAEESAIINMARLSVSADLSGATLYTTTYPCNLCANKIAQVGIKHIIYYEPYPQEEAKNILNKHNVKQIPFEGITFNGYFRFMEVLR